MNDEELIGQIAQEMHNAFHELYSRYHKKIFTLPRILLVDGEGHLRGLYNDMIPLEAGRIIDNIRLLLDERRL